MNPEHAHAWVPIDGSMGRYSCACGAIAGKVRGQMVVRKNPKRTVEEPMQDRALGNARNERHDAHDDRIAADDVRPTRVPYHWKHRP